MDFRELVEYMTSRREIWGGGKTIEAQKQLVVWPVVPLGVQNL
jgi:hypothetical protein